MKLNTYDITVTETWQKTVHLQADSLDAAQCAVTGAYISNSLFFNVEDYLGVEMQATELPQSTTADLSLVMADFGDDIHVSLLDGETTVWTAQVPEEVRLLVHHDAV